MTKTATCETCIFAHRYPESKHPGPREEKKNSVWETLFGKGESVNLEKFRYAVASDEYITYELYRRCKRFPKVERKHKNDFCGEYKNSANTN